MMDMAGQGRRRVCAKSLLREPVEAGAAAAVADGAIRQRARQACLLALCLIPGWYWLAEPLAAQTIDWSKPAGWQQDAEPADLFFIDRDHGWIVGDRGLVLRTQDGGQSWQPVTLRVDQAEPQAPPIDCRLESVFFVSPTHGWIAGGYVNPCATTSTGVLFATVDGGNTWKPLPGVALPRIRKVKFTTPLEGLAVGDGNALKPTGIFYTRDGGRSWSTRTGGPVQSWRAADHREGTTVLVSVHDSLARSANGELAGSLINHAGQTHSPPWRIRQFRLQDARFGYACGDDGLLLHTRNGGYSWDPLVIPDAAAADFRSLEIRGDRIWIVGDPGTCIWIGSVGSSAWQKVPTPLQTPLSRLFFVDETYGWAVGICGDVIHTQDGGQTWSLQRRGTGGIALLQVACDPGDFVPELFSRYCSEENYIGGALLLELLAVATGEADKGKPAIAPWSMTPGTDHVRQALSRCGGAFVIDRSVPRPAGQPGSDSRHPVNVLARQIRSLRPRVIALPSGGGRDLNDLRGYELQAIRVAADTSQPAVSGQDHWQVGKVVMMDRGDVASLKISPAHYLMERGALLTDHAAVSRLLLGQSVTESFSVSLTTIFTRPWATGPSHRLFGGIENVDTGIPLRKGRERTAGNLAQMRQLASKQKALDRLLDGLPNTSPRMWSHGLADLTMRLDAAAAGVWLFELASHCHARGETGLAAETHLYLTSQYRRHPLATASFRWLYNYYVSAEQAHVLAREARLGEAEAVASEIPDIALPTRPVTRQVNGIDVITWEVNDPRNQTGEIRLTAGAEPASAPVVRRRLQQARALSRSFALIDPAALDTGRYELSRIGLNRRLDPLISVNDQLKRLATSPDPALAGRALQELNIANRRPPTGSPTGTVPLEIVCLTATRRPWLDGQLDDPVWAAAIRTNSLLPLSIASRDSQTSHTDQILMACDEQFLYLAVRCLQQSGLPYEIDDQPRDRDSPLTASDRVEIAIDIDRDYQTCFLLCVNASGRLAESLGDNVAWDPQWFVASRLDDEYWIAEIAIPLDEISRHGDYWSVAASRHIRRQLVSTTWQSPEAAALTIPANQPSLHAAALQQQSGLQALPLPAFRLVRMPWSDDKSTTTRDLPDEQ
jgi:photosystem II stability/assembly factor-like uncharacterized protein